jgi:transcription initiation factor TFIIIB Brf1 subunit/transcription initiation factor TFIIB
MTDFNLFEQALNQYQKNNPNIKQLGKNKQKCTHTKTVNDNNIVLCTDCGEEISKNILHEKEWRYYGQSDTKHTSDPNRVQMRKIDDRNIYKDVENMGFSDKIVSKANKIYSEVTKGQIKRGNSRKAIVFACIFQSAKLYGRPQTHDKLIRIFNLSRKTGLQGLKHVTLNAPKNSEIHTSYITPVHLVEDMMDKFQASDEQKQEVIDIYNKIKNKNSKLNRSRPQSVSSGIIYYWILKTKKDISLKEFTKKAELSELTISKIAKIVSEVLKTPEII